MNPLATKILEMSKPYFGPAAEQFLGRQCKTHLKIELGTISKSELKELSKWVELSGGLIMDAGKASEIAKKIAAL